MTFLIDGYNLFYAAGFSPGATAKRAAFDGARSRFLDWLAAVPFVRRGEAGVRIAFDAAKSLTDLGSRSHRGLEISFSFRETADDLIERWIRDLKRPTDFTVVSNDGRLRGSALRGGCQWMSCEEYLDLVNAGKIRNPRTPTPAAPEKPPPTSEDWSELLRVFQQPKPRG